ncbi:MAG: SIS domain-containing protein [Candidatus Poseidoniaceae archaeon]|jgi:glucose/mannose-6-phosphate isomerase|nr:SIS domain-containing protein [Candidatus Poseidoniaceae archaeon]
MKEDLEILATSLDKENMIGFTRKFIEDIRIGQDSVREDLLPWLSELKHDWDGVLFLGMGGSAAAGDFLCTLAEWDCGIPMFSCKGYDLPSWWNNRWLVISTSYSGNTEETLSATKQALERGATIIIISSGGELAGLCELSQTVFLISCPSGQPPRSAFGHILSRQLALLSNLNILNSVLDEEEMKRLSLAIENSDIVKYPHGDVASLALNLINNPIAIIGPRELEPALTRFKNQINENAARFVRIGILPEMNHNEIVAWGGVGDEGDIDAEKQAVILLSWEKLHPRVYQRMDWFVSNCPTENAWRIHGEGDSLLGAMLHLCILMDWLSIALALLHGKDPSSISSIISLKEYLSQIDQ